MPLNDLTDVHVFSKSWVSSRKCILYSALQIYTAWFDLVVVVSSCDESQMVFMGKGELFPYEDINAVQTLSRYISLSPQQKVRISLHSSTRRGLHF